MNRNVVFVQIMECTDPDVINELAHYIWDAFLIRERVLT